uniref:Uncharacterized protein n=1 Tax=Glossina austeni TaxID=7395 RepID=A0A1A9VUU0_GLOAU
MYNNIVEIIVKQVTIMPEAWYSSQSATARVDNYILQHQRQFEQQLKDIDRQLDDFRNSYVLRLSVIEAYDQIVADKLKEMENKFYPLEMLNEVNDFCVEKYRDKIPIAHSVKSHLKECMRKASSALSTMLKNPEDTLKNMRNHFIKTTDTYFITNLNNFLNQINSAGCMANTKFDEAFDCYSAQVYSTFTAIGEAAGFISNCMAGHDVCPPCNDENLSAVKGRCPYHMAWHLEDDDLSGETIFNPFKGINNTTPCLQINFITNDFRYTGTKFPESLRADEDKMRFFFRLFALQFIALSSFIFSVKRSSISKSFAKVLIGFADPNIALATLPENFDFIIFSDLFSSKEFNSLAGVADVVTISGTGNVRGFKFSFGLSSKFPCSSSGDLLDVEMLPERLPNLQEPATLLWFSTDFVASVHLLPLLQLVSSPVDLLPLLQLFESLASLSKVRQFPPCFLAFCCSIPLDSSISIRRPLIFGFGKLKTCIRSSLAFTSI